MRTPGTWNDHYAPEREVASWDTLVEVEGFDRDSEDYERVFTLAEGARRRSFVTVQR